MTKFHKDWGTGNVKDIIPSLRASIKGSKNSGDWAQKARKHFSNKTKGEETMTIIKPAFSTNPFSQRLYEAEMAKEDPKVKEQQEKSKKESKKVHGTHQEACKAYLRRLEDVIDNHGGKEPGWYEVDRLKKVHDRLKDVHDYLDRYRDLPLRTVTEGTTSPEIRPEAAPVKAIKEEVEEIEETNEEQVLELFGQYVDASELDDPQEIFDAFCEEHELNELSRKTLGSYIQQAVGNPEKQSLAVLGDNPTRKRSESRMKYSNRRDASVAKWNKRFSGVNLAVNKLTNKKSTKQGGEVSPMLIKMKSAKVLAGKK